MHFPLSEIYFSTKNIISYASKICFDVKKNIKKIKENPSLEEHQNTTFRTALKIPQKTTHHETSILYTLPYAITRGAKAIALHLECA
jgi:hypothetical protein